MNDVLRRRWQSGESLRKLAKQLGLSNHTVQFWRSHWGERKKRGAELRRVEVISEVPLPANHLTVHGPAGMRVDGLTTDEVADLWRKLS